MPADFSGIGHSQLMAFGNWLFDDEFIDGIPIQTPHLSGAAYILPYRTDSSVKSGHRIYLKHMLLTEEGNTLLPSWAFFLRCFLNTRNLRPTASREDFYEDQELEEAREEFEEAVRNYLERLEQHSRERLMNIVNTHAEAIKAMAVWDDRMFRLFIDYLSFETSEGTCTGAFLKQAGEAEWISSVPRFQQLKPLFMAQGRLLICTGYMHDEEIIRKLAHMFSLPIQPFREGSMDLVLEELNPLESQCTESFSAIASQVLRKFDCQAEIKRFLPVDLPVIYSMSDEIQFLRQVQFDYKGAYVCFHELAKGKDSVTLQLPEEFPLYTKDGVYSCKELERWFYERAGMIGDRFDKRNGSQYFQENLAKVVL